MGSKVSVVKLPKSGGVSQRQQQARQAARNERIFEYFNGPDRTLHPVTVTMDPEKLRVFRLGELAGACVYAATLPVGLSCCATGSEVTAPTRATAGQSLQQQKWACWPCAHLQRS
jgi:hypothetical protein